MVKSEEVRIVFDATRHLPRVWKQVKELGLDVEQLERDWKYHLTYFAVVANSESENFLQWGSTILNIQLNTKLGRISSHPTFYNMLYYLLREEIERSETLAKIKGNKVNTDG
jgi:hypothetical protein